MITALDIILASIGTILLVFLGLMMFRFYLMFSTRVHSKNGISSLERVELGGLEQWVFIRGADQSNPVLLFLHGGPGEPIAGIASTRRLDKDLLEHFTVVHWDQRGAGKSYDSSLSAESMTFDRLVEDCSELIDYLCAKFGVDKVFLVAHSGGTIIGLRTAHRYPEKIQAYVGIAQITNEYEQQKMSYEFILEEAKKTGKAKDIATIESLGPPPYETPDRYLEMSRRIGKYGGFIHRNTMRLMLGVVLNYLTSPEYSISEGIKTLRGTGFHFTMDAMWDEMKKINLKEIIHSLKVPLYFIVGKYDMIVPTELVQNYYNHLEAIKGKELFIFESSGHFPLLEEKQKYQDILINIVAKSDRGIRW